MDFAFAQEVWADSGSVTTSHQLITALLCRQARLIITILDTRSDPELLAARLVIEREGTTVTGSPERISGRLLLGLASVSEDASFFAAN